MSESPPSNRPSWQLPVKPVNRLLGLDRSSILPTFAVLFLVLLWSVAMPAIDQSVDALKIEEGAVYDMGVATFQPSPGWLLVKPPSPVGTSKLATVFKDEVSFLIKTGNWNDNASALLDRLVDQQNEFIAETKEKELKTASGLSGVARRINGPDFTGLLMAFVDDSGHGVEIIIRGPADSSEMLAQSVSQMIQSIEFEETSPATPSKNL